MSNSEVPDRGDAVPPPPPPPPPLQSPGAGSASPPTKTSGNTGCATVIGLVFLIGGIALIGSGSSSGFNDTCSSYPEDGYCSLQDLVQGAGWFVLIIGLAALARVAWSGREKRK